MKNKRIRVSLGEGKEGRSNKVTYFGRVGGDLQKGGGRKRDGLQQTARDSPCDARFESPPQISSGGKKEGENLMIEMERATS